MIAEKRLKAVEWIAYGIVCTWFAVLGLVLLMLITDAERMTALGQAGDVFGSVNALFTGLSLIGVAYALMLQFDQAKQTRVDQHEAARLANETARIGLLHAKISALAALATANAAAATTPARNVARDTAPGGFEMLRASNNVFFDSLMQTRKDLQGVLSEVDRWLPKVPVSSKPAPAAQGDADTSRSESQ